LITRAALLVTAAMLAWPSAAHAQASVVRARLAADPDRRGPAAWTWIRSGLLPQLECWPRGLDPQVALELEFSEHGVRAAAAAQPKASDDYLTAYVELHGIGTIRVRANFDGVERWSGRGLAAPRGHTARFLDLLGVADAADPIVFDVAALVGNWLPGLAEDDPLYPLLALGPAECGKLTMTVEATGPDLTVVGRSHGGLLIPALLCYLADRRHSATDHRIPSSADRWVLLARCARDTRREEAARQLALCDDPEATDTLERLLHSEDFTRVVAMDALIRRGDTASMAAVLAALKPGQPATEQLSETALRSWLGRGHTAQQASVLPVLETDEHSIDQPADRTLALTVACITAFALAMAIRWRG